MKPIINGQDINDVLMTFIGDHVRIEIKSHNREHIHVICGTVTAEMEHIDVPYNPLMDTDCGTDAMIGRGK